MTFYISGVSAIVLAVFYFPLVFWLLRHVIRSTRWKGAKKVGALILTFAIAYAIPLGDVTWYSIAMARACPQAGLHVFKRVSVDGYLDSSASPESIKTRGYRYMEAPTPDGKFIRFEQRPGGEVSMTKVERPLSEYEVVYEDALVDRDLDVRRERWWVRARNTGEAVGEWLKFGARIGWVDRYLVFRWFGGSLGGCDGAHAPWWREEILPPSSNQRLN